MTPAYDELVETVRREGTLLLELADGHFDEACPTCGAWSVGRLVAHLGRVYRNVARIVAERRQASPDDMPPIAGSDVIGYYREAHSAVVEALDGALPHEDVWNWSAHRPAAVSFWARRMAHETLVHRWDAELATTDKATAEDVSAELAADCIDEFLEVMLPRQQSRQPTADLDGTVQLIATDDGLRAGEGDWRLVLTPTSCDIHRSRGDADVTLTGPAHRLALVLYNRLPADTVEVDGDPRVLDVWRSGVTV